MAAGDAGGTPNSNNKWQGPTLEAHRDPGPSSGGAEPSILSAEKKNAYTPRQQDGVTELCRNAGSCPELQTSSNVGVSLFGASSTPIQRPVGRPDGTSNGKSSSESSEVPTWQRLDVGKTDVDPSSSARLPLTSTNPAGATASGTSTTAGGSASKPETSKARTMTPAPFVKVVGAGERSEEACQAGSLVDLTCTLPYGDLLCPSDKASDDARCKLRHNSKGRRGWMPKEPKSKHDAAKEKAAATKVADGAKSLLNTKNASVPTSETLTPAPNSVPAAVTSGATASAFGSPHTFSPWVQVHTSATSDASHGLREDAHGTLYSLYELAMGASHTGTAAASHSKEGHGRSPAPPCSSPNCEISENGPQSWLQESSEKLFERLRHREPSTKASWLREKKLHATNECTRRTNTTLSETVLSSWEVDLKSQCAVSTPHRSVGSKANGAGHGAATHSEV